VGKKRDLPGCGGFLKRGGTRKKKRGFQQPTKGHGATLKKKGARKTGNFQNTRMGNFVGKWGTVGQGGENFKKRGYPAANGTPKAPRRAPKNGGFVFFGGVEGEGKKKKTQVNTVKKSVVGGGKRGKKMGKKASKTARAN